MLTMVVWSPQTIFTMTASTSGHQPIDAASGTQSCGMIFGMTMSRPMGPKSMVSTSSTPLEKATRLGGDGWRTGAMRRT